MTDADKEINDSETLHVIELDKMTPTESGEAELENNGHKEADQMLPESSEAEPRNQDADTDHSNTEVCLFFASLLPFLLLFLFCSSIVLFICSVNSSYFFFCRCPTS